MADSNTTKLALSHTLKELLRERPFEKISISDICEGCGMNRKSFYYHFRDKFDLVNWTFDREFGELIQENGLDIPTKQNSFNAYWKGIEIICTYFYENRHFYSRILTVRGQNSFSSHFREYLRPLIHSRFAEMFGMDDLPEMACDFVVDGIVCSIERWLLDKQCVNVEEFMFILGKLTQVMLLDMKRRAEEDPKWLELTL